MIGGLKRLAGTYDGWNAVAEDLNRVLVAERAALGLGETAEMHQARHVHPGEEIRLDVEDVVEFERTHPPRNVGKCHTKGATETTALLGLAEWNDCRVANRTQQFAGGSAGSSPAAVARAVKRNLGGLIKCALPGLDPKAVVNEVDDFPSAVSQ